MSPSSSMALASSSLHGPLSYTSPETAVESSHHPTSVPGLSPCAEHHNVVGLKTLPSQKPKNKTFPAAFKVLAVRNVSCKGNSISMLQLIFDLPSMSAKESDIVSIRLMCVVTWTQLHWDLDCNQQQIMWEVLNRLDQIVMKF